MRRYGPGIVCLLLVAAAPAVAETINGCVDQKGVLRIVAPEQPCDAKEYALSWSSTVPNAPAAIGTIKFGPGPTAPLFQFGGGGVEMLGDVYGGGGGSGKAEFAPIAVMRQVDSSSPELFLSCATGKHFPDVVITFSGGTTRTMRLSDALITGYQLATPDGAGTQFELITVDWRKIEINFDGETACYDVAAAKKC